MSDSNSTDPAIGDSNKVALARLRVGGLSSSHRDGSLAPYVEIGPPLQEMPPRIASFPVTRVHAASIAADRICQAPGFDGLLTVLSLDEIRFARPHIFQDSFDLSTCWVAYARPRLLRIEASHVIVISAESGDVVYEGSANDEG